MPLHTDKRGFVYATFRQGGRVCRRYVGKASSERVAVALELDATGRELTARARELEREQRTRETARIEEERREVAAPVARLDAQTSALVSDVLEALGYRRTRGQWRKSRKDEPMTKALQTQEEARKAARTKQIKAAENGDKSAALAFWSDADALALTGPEGAQRRAQSVKEAGDMAARAVGALIGKMTQDDFLRAGGIRRHMEAMKANLSGPNPTPLEVLLIDRVCACWLHSAYFEGRLAASLGTSTLKQQESHQRQIDSAHKRYLAALKALAQIRKLQLPTVQINVGEKQVNIGTFNGPNAPDVAAPVAFDSVED